MVQGATQVDHTLYTNNVGGAMGLKKMGFKVKMSICARFPSGQLLGHRTEHPKYPHCYHSSGNLLPNTVPRDTGKNFPTEGFSP